MSVAYQQIPLNLQLRAEATLDNFVASGNEALLHILCESTERYIYLWGEAACGKSHLLQALCHRAYQQQQTAAYIPLRDDDISDAEILIGLEDMDLVCIDDLHVIAGQAEWEIALFNLFNRIRENNGRLIITAGSAPNNMQIQLADLLSRLNWGVVFQLATLQDQARLEVLQLRARQLGLELPEEVVTYMLKRSPRDMASLFALLTRLDSASLAAQRRLTIPFVRQYL